MIGTVPKFCKSSWKNVQKEDKAFKQDQSCPQCPLSSHSWQEFVLKICFFVSFSLQVRILFLLQDFIILLLYLYILAYWFFQRFLNKSFTWLNITYIWWFLKVYMKHFFEVLGPVSITAKNEGSISNHFCTELSKKNLYSFWFLYANFAWIETKLQKSSHKVDKHYQVLDETLNKLFDPWTFRQLKSKIKKKLIIYLGKMALACF